MKKLLSIKEFSELSKIEPTTLRYWDEIGLFSPAMRNEQNNYRYYSPEQIVAVNFISVLSNLNVPLKTISQLTRNRTPEKIIKVIEQQEHTLDMEMNRLRECYSVIHSRRELLNYGMNVLNNGSIKPGGRRASDKDAVTNQGLNEITVVHRPEKAIIVGPRNKFEGDSFYKPFLNFCKQAKDLRINLNFPIGAMFDNIESFFAHPGQPDYFFSLDPTGNAYRPEGDYLVGFSRDYYGELGDLPEKLQNHIRENQIIPTGRVYSMYLLDEICYADTSKYVAQVCVAIDKK